MTRLGGPRLGNTWLTQSSGVFAGWIHPHFDELLTTDERQHVFLRLAEAVSRRDDLTPEAKATLELLVALIRGELSTDASSPLDYMVSGQFPITSYKGNRPDQQQLRIERSGRRRGIYWLHLGGGYGNAGMRPERRPSGRNGGAAPAAQRISHSGGKAVNPG